MTITKGYTEADAGCYVDGARGIYAVDRIVDFAESHGMPASMPCTCGESCHDGGSYSACEFAGEFEQEAENYMQTHHAVDGHYWGRSEQGDWGLWALECSGCHADSGTTECPCCEDWVCSACCYRHIEEQSAPCPMCEGEGYQLGGLGNLLWFRCRACGMDFNVARASG